MSKEEEKRKVKDKCTHVGEAPTEVHLVDVNHWKPPDTGKAPAEIGKALDNVCVLF
jgi:hypothetical protein